MENKENIVETPALEATAPAKPAPKKRAPKKEATAPAKPAPAKKRIKKIDTQELVEVQSCAPGLLYYKSPTGDEVEWQGFGDVAWMTVGELMTMRNSHRKFFSRPWICLKGDNARDVLDYLQVSQYYNDIESIDSFDKIFDLPIDEAIKTIEALSDGTKDTLARRAYAKIQNGEIDSTKMIKALEEALGYDLTTPQ